MIKYDPDTYISRARLSLALSLYRPLAHSRARPPVRSCACLPARPSTRPSARPFARPLVCSSARPSLSMF